MTQHIVYFRDNNFIIEIMTNEILPISNKIINENYCDYITNEFNVINIEKIIKEYINCTTNYEINKTYKIKQIVSKSKEKISMLSCFEIPYHQNYKNQYKCWYSNGTLKEIYFNNSGNIDGLYRAYYDNSNIKYECNYKSGKKYGISKYFRENGTLYYESNFVDDIKKGKEKYYDESGNILDIFIYE